MHKIKFRAILATTLTVWVAGSALTRAICTPDPSESDDSCFASNRVLHGGQVLGRNFCDDASDWTAFNACAGRMYTIRTLNLEAAANTIVELYTPDCLTLLASDDNGGGGAASLLVWTAPADGVFHLQIRQADGTSGSDRAYDVEMTGDTSTCATWANRYQAPPDAYMSYFGAIADGGFIFSGGVFQESSFDASIAKLDAGGRIVWQRVIGGLDDEYGIKPVQTADGGFALAGQLGDDAWVVKLDASGTTQWQRSYIRTGTDTVADALATADGGLILAGRTTSTGNTDAWVLKLSATGAVDWSKRYGGGSFDEARAVTATSDGGFLVVGITQSFGAGGEDGWVLKLNVAGSIVWQKAYRGSGNDFLYAIAVTTGGAVVAGATDSFSPAANLWAVRLDDAGAVVWQTMYSGAHNGGVSVSATSDGGAAIGAQYYETPEFDGRLLRLDPAGNVVWNRREISPGVSSGVSSVEATPDGGLMIRTNHGDVDSIFRTDAGGSLANCPRFSNVPTTASATTAAVVTTNATAQDLVVNPNVTGAASGPGMLTRSSECPCVTAVTMTLQKLPSTQLAWTAGTGASDFDIVRGDLATLLSTDGDFTAALNAVPTLSVCMADNSAAFQLIDPAADPPAGNGYFYVVRAENIICRDYDDEVQQAGSRDEEIAAASGACP